jgi:hypothetical protein
MKPGDKVRFSLKGKRKFCAMSRSAEEDWTQKEWASRQLKRHINNVGIVISMCHNPDPNSPYSVCVRWPSIRSETMWYLVEEIELAECTNTTI